MSVTAGWPSCPGCSQPLATLRSRPDRTVCARCELYGPPDPAAPVAQPVEARHVPQPTRCSGCGQDKFGVADGRCLSCRLDGPAA